MPPPNKIIVAVHGIGDQTRKETIQSVVRRFCTHFNYSPLVPLGAFHRTGNAPFLPNGPVPPVAPLDAIGFAEVYWADIPRKVVKRGYTLQETKAWAKTIVERMRVLASAPGVPHQSQGIDYEKIGRVLGDLITAIHAMESLTFLAKRAQLFDFNLKKLLDDFVGDVQIVAEFETLRDKIVGVFDDTMDNVHTQFPGAEIYIVAHSEGTVVAWLGLLRAISARGVPPPRWLSQVRGFMTIGSPIDKHLILWPELFAGLTGPSSAGQNQIQWRNYADSGDPVGFELDTAREWMKRYGYDSHFTFRRTDDYLFSRYFMPGKAHTDYWEDKDVFEHFINQVVSTPPLPAGKELRDIRGAQLCSYIVGYTMPLMVVYGGVYLLYSSVGHYLEPIGVPDHMAKNIALLGAFVAGATVCWRMFALTRGLKWRCVGTSIFAVTTVLFLALADATPEMRWFYPFGGHAGSGIVGSATVAFAGLANGAKGSWMMIGISVVVAALFSQTFTGAPMPGEPEEAKRDPRFPNTKAIVVAVGICLLLNAVLEWDTADPRRSTMPVVGSVFGGVYLWWLAIMIFDLVFVWHRYIRHGAGLKYLRDVLWKTEGKPQLNR